MVGEKRKHSDAIQHVGMNTANGHADFGGGAPIPGFRCYESPVTALSTISCECNENGESSQKRQCVHPPHQSFSAQPASQLISAFSDLTSSEMEVDQSPVHQQFEMNGIHELSTRVPPGVDSVIPKPCVRCASGESGHINHIFP